MNSKIDNLYKQIYKKFITGEYGAPKIPTQSEVFKQIQSMTTEDYTPLFQNPKMTSVDINQIRTNFSGVIDDINILFNSVEEESLEVLNQLTNSLKENNGLSREFRRLDQSLNDVTAGKLNETYFQYNFTESFNSLDNIDANRSDPVDLTCGLFTLTSNSSNVIPMSHYIGRKLEFNVLEYSSPIVSAGFVGTADASAVLDQNDPRALLYRITTKSSTPLKVVLQLQLFPDGRIEEINKVNISVDSSVAKGSVRLYYRNSFSWQDIPANPIQPINNDQIQFDFDPVKSSHVKIEFIKDGPDNIQTSEYFVSLSNVAISLSSPNTEAVLYSKPIVLSDYNTEPPIISNISCELDADQPTGTSIGVFVAQDVKVDGVFRDIGGNKVDSSSPLASSFDPNASGDFVYLSEIWDAMDRVSGMYVYDTQDYQWNQIQTNGTDLSIPQILSFKNTISNKSLINTFYQLNPPLFGDEKYIGPVYLSGWCNSSNPLWDVISSGALPDFNSMHKLAASGLLVSGVTISGFLPEEDPITGFINSGIIADPRFSGQWLGYGQGYIFDTGYIFSSTPYYVNGWWRPQSSLVTASGINRAYDSSGSGWLSDDNYYLPDFSFNNIGYYKIFKFDKNSTVLIPTIKLYTYEECPITSSPSGSYFHQFNWNYVSSWTDQQNTLVNQGIPNYTGVNWTGYTVTVSGLTPDVVFTKDSLISVKKYNSNIVYSESSDFISTLTPVPTGILIDFTNLNNRNEPTSTTFDITCTFRVKNPYSSSWTGYAIVNPGDQGGEIQFSNSMVQGTSDWGIGTVRVTNIDTGIAWPDILTNSSYDIVFPPSDSTQHYEIQIFCTSDDSTDFSFKNSNGSFWVPSLQNGTISNISNARIVNNLNPLQMVTFDALLHNTSLGDDNRAALITELNGDKFVVVKKPSKANFPGYYYDNSVGMFQIDSVFNYNKSHFIKKGLNLDNSTFIYTTGSQDNKIYTAPNNIDISWNDGSTVVGYENTYSGTYYPIHTTYGYPLNLEEDQASTVSGILLHPGDIDITLAPNDPNRVVTVSKSVATLENRGFLFYCTAENLPAYYSISYLEAKAGDGSESRFVYKLDLNSNSDQTLIPRVRSIKFVLNRNLQ